MFTHDEKKSKPKMAKSLKDLIGMIPLEQILNEPKREVMLSYIKKSIGLSATGFDKLALPLLQQIARYCQGLPETSLYYAHRGGLLDRCLNRTEAALQLMLKILVIKKDESPSEEQKLWLYALFSASMLQGIGKLYTDYTVDLFDTNGQYLKQWQPLFEDLFSSGKYYQFDFLRGDDVAFRNHVTLILAKQMMPRAGFIRLSSNPEVFAVWLMLLQEVHDSTDPLAAILDRANAIAIQRDINEYLLKHTNRIDGQAHRISNFIDKTPDVAMDKERLVGAEFITWLTQGFANGKILINQLAQIVPSGIVISPELFDMFVREDQKRVNKNAVRQAFLAWNLHRLMQAAKESANITNKIQIDTALLPDTVKIFHPQSNKITTVATIDLVHHFEAYSQSASGEIKLTIHHLSSAGKWVPAEENIGAPHHVQFKRF